MPLNIRELSRKSKTGWDDLWDYEKNRYENTLNLFKGMIWVPNPEVQLPIVAVYSWLNSNWMDSTPYLLSYGREGSGKSAIASIIEGMHDLLCLQAESTAVSIRNEVNNSRFPNGEEGEEADCFFLVWDNVNLDTLKDKDVSNVFLSGAIRGKDRIAISSDKVGTNQYFRTFSPKVFSSVHPLHVDPAYRELSRRTMVVFHEQLNEDQVAELNLRSVDSVDFKGFFEEQIEPFYSNENRFLQYDAFRSNWNKTRFPASWKTARKRLLADFAATGHIIGAWETVAEAKEIIGQYEEYLRQKAGDCTTPLSQCVAKFIQSEGDVINPKDLTAHIDLYLGNSKLLEKPRTQELLDAMLVAGYSFVGGNWVKQ